MTIWGVKILTRTVTVEAHCADDKEVQCSIEDGNEAEGCTLQDGETESFVVYDNRKITVREVEK